MKKNLKILLAVNFSARSKLAMKSVNWLKKFYKIDVILVHVLLSFWKDWLASGVYQKSAFERLKTWQKTFTEPSDKALYVDYGNPANVILEVAQSKAVDLIVLGGKDSSKNQRYPSSITLESVIRSAQQPVWITQGKPATKILCAIDGSPSSVKTMNWALSFAHHFKAHLCVVHALPRPDFNPLGMEKQEVQRQGKLFEKEKIEALNQFLESFDFSGLSFEKQFLWGNPANVILDMMADFGYDLIVIGAKGHSMLHHVFLGSVAEKVIRHADCSLFVVR